MMAARATNSMTTISKVRDSISVSRQLFRTVHVKRPDRVSSHFPFASLSTHAFHVLDTTRSNPFQEHGTTLDRSTRQVIHPFQKRAMVVVSQHKPGENVSDHNISSGPNDEASSSGALQPSSRSLCF